MEAHGRSLSHLLADSITTETNQEARPHGRRLKKIVQQLMLLDCPYLQDIEESVVKEIVLSAGEAHVRVIQWLIGRFHPKFQGILFSAGISTTTVHSLTSLLADMGLCSREDYDLVQGNATISRQLPFLEALIDLIEISGCNECATMSLPHERLSQKVDSCCCFMDNLLRQEDVKSVFPKTLELIPPGISKVTALDSTIEGSILRERMSSRNKLSSLQEKIGQRNDVPTYNELSKQLEVLITTLEQGQTELDQLTYDYRYEPLSAPALDSVQKCLLVSLNTLSQLATNFCHLYETEIQPWTNRSMPVFTSLGPCCKRVDTHRKQVEQLLQSVDLLQSSLLSIINVRDNYPATNSKLCQKALETFHDCLKVLKTLEQ